MFRSSSPTKQSAEPRSLRSALIPSHSPTATTSAHGEATAARIIRPLSALPGSRAFLGGLLITIAALGTFLLATHFSQPSTVPIVVAAKELPIGTQVQAADVAVRRVHADAATTAHTFSDAAVVVGAITLGPLHAGELLQRGALVRRSLSANSVEMSFALPSSRAVDGTLIAGEYVNVIATNKTAGTSAQVLSDARVLRMSASGSGLGKTGDATVTLGLDTPELAVALANAVDGSQVTLIRTAASSSAAGPTPMPAAVPPAP